MSRSKDNDALVKEQALSVQKNIYHLDLVATNINLSAAEMELVSSFNREKRLFGRVSEINYRSFRSTIKLIFDKKQQRYLEETNFTLEEANNILQKLFWFRYYV